MQEYTYNFISKKREAGHSIEYSDYVMLVVYPQLVRNVKSAGDWNGIDRVKLMLLANDYANEPHYKDIIDPINRYRMIRTLYTHPKKTMVMPDLKNVYLNFIMFMMNLCENQMD